MMKRAGERGVALVVVLFILVILFALAIALLFQSFAERVVSINEQDHIKALGFAEAGVSWVERRIKDAGGDYDAMLTNPGGAGPACTSNLPGLRDLTLTSTGQFTASNEARTSAIVERDFTGDGDRCYEVVRLEDDTHTRALVYVRVDDNYDDDPSDPSNNDPFDDKDHKIRVTAVAEYPVFVDSGGNEVPNRKAERGRAQRMLVATYGGANPPQYAIATDGDLDITDSLDVCGDCGSVHANQDLDRGSGGSICQNATATDRFRGSATGVSGESGGRYPPIYLPTISPYDDVFVPRPDIFTNLGCPAPTTTDPGSSKYFAMVADGGNGRVYKAYRDFANDRWTWREIDNLNDAIDVKLDNCGRAPGDPSYGSGVTDKPGDPAGVLDEFYGFKAGGSTSLISCPACGNNDSDKSLCTTADNDFTLAGYYDANAGSPQRGQGVSATVSLGPPLPGSFTANGLEDFDSDAWHKDGIWDHATDTVFSPLYGAVVFFYANLSMSHNPAHPSSTQYCSSSGCGSTVPANLWKVSLISYGSIEVSGQMRLGPANPAAGYAFQLIAGRDVLISGNPAELLTACSGICPGTAPGNIVDLGGIYAAHEQIQISGNPNIFGFIVAEDALDCSTTVDAQSRGASTINGSANVFYDCVHPLNPWATGSDVEQLAWQEVE